MKRIATLFLIFFYAGLAGEAYCVALTNGTGSTGSTGVTSTLNSTTRSVSTTYMDSAGAALNPNTSQVVSPKAHIPQPTAPSNLGTMSQVSTFIGTSANNCNATTRRDTCFVALTASAGGTTTNNAPLCPQGYVLLFSTGSFVMDSSGNQMQWTASFSQSNLNQSQYNFYNSNGFSCSSGNTYTDVGNTAIQGNQAGSPCGWFCVNSANKPGVSQFKTNSGNYNVGDMVSYNGHYGKLTGVTDNGYSCYTLPHVSAPDSSCGWVAGAYWETYSKGTFQSYTCTRSAGFYYDGGISNPNNYSMPSTQALPYTSPTVSICGKLKYSTNWQY